MHFSPHVITKLQRDRPPFRNPFGRDRPRSREQDPESAEVTTARTAPIPHARRKSPTDPASAREPSRVTRTATPRAEEICRKELTSADTAAVRPPGSDWTPAAISVPEGQADPDTGEDHAGQQVPRVVRGAGDGDDAPHQSGGEQDTARRDQRAEAAYGPRGSRSGRAPGRARGPRRYGARSSARRPGTTARSTAT